MALYFNFMMNDLLILRLTWTVIIINVFTHQWILECSRDLLLWYRTQSEHFDCDAQRMLFGNWALIIKCDNKLSTISLLEYIMLLLYAVWCHTDDAVNGGWWSYALGHVIGVLFLAASCVKRGHILWVRSCNSNEGMLAPQPHALIYLPCLFTCTYTLPNRQFSPLW